MDATTPLVNGARPIHDWEAGGARHGYPGRVSRPRLRAFRARALCVTALAMAGVIALAAGVASGQGSAARTKGSSYAVLISVPGAQSSGTLTSPSGSYTYRDLLADPAS